MTVDDRDVVIIVGLVSVAVAAFVEPRAQDWRTRRRLRRDVHRARRRRPDSG